MTILEALIQLRDDIKLWCINNFNHKLNKNLGTEENGKFLTVDSSGDIVTTNFDNNVFIATWGTTYGTKIETAYQAGKTIFCDYQGKILNFLERTSQDNFKFGATIGSDYIVASFTDENWNASTESLADGMTEEIIDSTKLFVTVADDGNSGYTSDKTYAEIVSAIDMGKSIDLQYGDLRFTYVGYNSSRCRFYAIETIIIETENPVILPYLLEVRIKSDDTVVIEELGTLELSGNCVEINQGTSNAGKILVVGSDGNLKLATIADVTAGNY